MKTSDRLTDIEYEKLSLEYEQNPPELSGNSGFLSEMRERALIAELLSPEYVRIVNAAAQARSMSPGEVIRYCIREHVVGK